MKTSRRDFIKNTGYVAIGFSIIPNIAWMATGTPECEQDAFLVREGNINDWLQVLEDGRVRIFTGKMELGQGIRIAIAQVAAEELNMDIDLVEVQLAETGTTPDEGHTAGSRSVETSAMSVRKAAAAAGGIILQRASQQFEVEKDLLYLENGNIHSKDGKVISSLNNVLAGAQIEEGMPANVETKSKENYSLVGKPILRRDIKNMLLGESVYVQDLRFPGMLHARMIRPPAYDAKLENLSYANLKSQIEGITIFRKNDLIAVLSEEEYQAEKAQRILQQDVQWEAGTALPKNDNFKKYIKNLPAKTETVEDKGQVKFGSSSVKAAYSKPYIMHASVGPSCAVAFYKDEQLHIWSHTQGVYPLREAVSKLLSIPVERIKVSGVPGSGCYGHNGADDVAAEAAVLAVENEGRHIRLQWTREEEHAWEPYGSTMLMELEADLTSNGRINAWKYNLWSDTHSTRPGGNKENLLAHGFYEGQTNKPRQGFTAGAYRNSVPYYQIPNKKIEAHSFDGPLRVSALRGLGAYSNIFAVESFMDELAEKAGKDPVAFRLEHLQDPRAKDVLEKVREMTAEVNLGDNEGLGFAFSRYKNSASYCAVAAKVFVDENNRVWVRDMWGAIDAGEVINPDGLKNQTEGGMIQSASWTLREQVAFNETHVSSRDWNSYPVFRFSDVPTVSVAVIERQQEPPLGAGEAAQGPAGAAIANALYRATGKRVRDLPINSR